MDNQYKEKKENIKEEINCFLNLFKETKNRMNSIYMSSNGIIIISCLYSFLTNPESGFVAFMSFFVCFVMMIINAIFVDCSVYALFNKKTKLKNKIIQKLLIKNGIYNNSKINNLINYYEKMSKESKNVIKSNIENIKKNQGNLSNKTINEIITVEMYTNCFSEDFERTKEYINVLEIDVLTQGVILEKYLSRLNEEKFEYNKNNIINFIQENISDIKVKNNLIKQIEEKINNQNNENNKRENLKLNQKLESFKEQKKNFNDIIIKNI